MAKIIVTHFYPDLDAVTAVWLIKRFLPGWTKAEVKFVSAGETFRGAPPDSDPEILHVDTGHGKLDHHQKGEYSSAAGLVLKKIFKEKKFSEIDKETLKRLVAIVTEIDNGRMITWENASSDRYEFCLHNLLSGFEKEGGDEAIISLGLSCLNGVFKVLKDKVLAEKILKEEGKVFRTRWGKAVAVESFDEQVLMVGQKKGFIFVARKNPKSGHLRIYSRWDKKVDLTKAYEEFKKKDPKATWYLHPTKHLLLNGSRGDPNRVSTKLSLSEIIKILEKA
ncbi:hypothetical protein COU95_01695 [Candidatus Shapirobacteria bacterium CG10_big_fil_rev_8_21_14_0_10_40_9]|uniref:Uncharacterized protein n=1 Tax=Candidatus Shapirobacteria bacterium CG10_big_fil_rev_8_21_14_0_10_40_9 TaxID=1974888 RepID=A0A2M8L3V6_9BACT|nr:MAG: hypothetical protein COU95_01695 [Candidatus Shapirobacteria bacterium CG10_big_fil_rev_8_21_14_0_10_40_9]